MADSGDLRFSRRYIGERCRKLTNYGLLPHLGNGVYRIMETGEQYLEGEGDAGDLESEHQTTVPLKQLYSLPQDPLLEKWQERVNELQVERDLQVP